MKRPRLFAACAELPWPTDSGHKLVSMNDLRYLSEVYDIDALNYVSTRLPADSVRRALDALGERLPAVRFLEPVRHDITGKHGRWDKGLQLLRSLFAGIPYIVSKYRNGEYAERVRRQLAENDYAAVLIESTPLSYLFREVPEIARRPVIFRAHDMLSETIDKFGAGGQGGIDASVARMEATRTRKFEEGVWAASTVIAPVTQRLTSLIAERTGRSQMDGVIYLPVVAEPGRAPEMVPDTGSNLVLYVGTVHYPPNLQGLQWFLANVWPLIVESNPRARFRIIGKGGSLLGEQPSSVEVLDYVDSLTDHYAAADVLVVPLFSGSGIRLKILEAFAHGIPVVSSTEGYLGLDVVPGEQLLVADEPGSYAQAVVEVLASRDKRMELRRRSAEFLRVCHGEDRMRQAVGQLRSSLGGRCKRVVSERERVA